MNGTSKTMSRRMAWWLLGLLSLTVLTASCSAMQRNAARQQYIYDQVDGYVFERPLESVFPIARELLFEQGYQTRDSGGGTTVETEWREDTGVRHRVLATGIPQGEATCQVHFTRDVARADTQESETGRDHELEWQLVRRVEPERAQKIADDAEAYADKMVPEQ